MINGLDPPLPRSRPKAHDRVPPNESETKSHLKAQPLFGPEARRIDNAGTFSLSLVPLPDSQYQRENAIPGRHRKVASWVPWRDREH